MNRRLFYVTFPLAGKERWIVQYYILHERWLAEFRFTDPPTNKIPVAVRSDRKLPSYLLDWLQVSYKKKCATLFSFLCRCGLLRPVWCQAIISIRFLYLTICRYKLIYLAYLIACLVCIVASFYVTLAMQSKNGTSCEENDFCSSAMFLQSD